MVIACESVPLRSSASSAVNRLSLDFAVANAYLLLLGGAPLLSWSSLVIFAACLWGADLPSSPAERVGFRRDIRPILSENCFFCHGPDAAHREADLRLDEREGAFRTRKGKTPVAPGRSGSSELLRRITHTDVDERMPPAESGKKLAARQVELIRLWIDQGAPWEDHWAYTKLERPAVPEVSDPNWPVNAIDRFILARLDRAGLRSSPEAGVRPLIRRVHFDLTGLPPSSADVKALAALADPETLRLPDREYEKLVDLLLESPHYGERMAVHWLDLVRYADTVGYHGDQEHAISPYRDYVIQAFNENMPFDRFTIEQIAGDLLPDSTIDQKIASGYNRLLQTSHEGGVQVKEYLAKYSADRVRNLGSVWLGSTLGCAECHNHKFDPFTQRDFYRLAAFFADVDDLKTFKGGDTSPTRREPELEVLSGIDRDRIRKLEEDLGRMGAASQAAADLQATIRDLQRRKRRTMVTASIAPRPIRVLARGDWMDETGEVVEPGVPGALPQILREGRATRLDLARWLVEKRNPLTSRVFANRIWRLFFGKGISSRLDDLGAQGEPPVHPELLDWLAVEFMESGWDVKRLVKLIATSRTYRQTSTETGEHRLLDPQNRLVARQNRMRLEAELVRDGALAVSGLLVREICGSSVRPYQPDGYYQHLNFPKRSYKSDSGPQQYRRSVYTHWQRSLLHPMLKAFDAPSREECTAERAVSNTPQAALVLLNDPTFVEAARTFAARILREGGATPIERVRWGWHEALSRYPSEREAVALVRLYEQDREEFLADPKAAASLFENGIAPVPDGIDPTELAAWTSVARALLNLDETITRP